MVARVPFVPCSLHPANPGVINKDRQNRIMRTPIVIVPARTRQIGDFPYHAAQVKYVDAVVLGARCAPVVLPALGPSRGIALAGAGVVLRSRSTTA